MTRAKRCPGVLGTMLLLLLVGVTAAAAPAGSMRLVTAKIYVPRGNPGPDCARVFPLTRQVRPPAVLAGSMRSLLAGPSAAERRRGYGGWFSVRTAKFLRSVRIRGGVALIDFRNFARLIPNASTSCGSAMLLAQLDRTARQFPGVKRAIYSFDGSSRTFYEWLQRGPPAPGR